MKIKEILLSNKKRTGFLISLALMLGGIIPLMIFTFIPDIENPYTIKQITLESEDKTLIQALVYKPEDGSKGNPGIVVAHGFCGNKQYMQPLSIELAKRGFTVVSIDFRGHGSSGGYLSELRREKENNPLVGDMMAAVEYLERLDVEGIGLVGHSMGGRTSLLTAEEHPKKIDATVSIGMIETDYDFNNINNLMMAIGRYEQIFSEKNAIEFLKEYTGKKNVEIDKLYGDFNDGDATKVVIGPSAEHLTEVLDSVIIYETVQWFEQTFNGNRADDVHLTVVPHQISFVIALIGVVMMFFLICIYLNRYMFPEGQIRPKNDDFRGKNPVKLGLLYIFGALIGAIFLYPLSLMFVSAIPVSMGHVLYGFIVGTAIGLLIAYYLLIIRKSSELNVRDIPLKIKQMCPTSVYRSILFGVIAGLIIITLLSSLMHWSTNASFLTTREIGTVFALTILFYPFLLIKEFFLRSIQEELAQPNRIKEYFSIVGIGIVLDNIFLFLLMAVSWQNSDPNLGFIALSMTAIVIFSVIQHFLPTWVYMHSGRNIMASTMFLCILYGWMIVNFFPFGINAGFF